MGEVIEPILLVTRNLPPLRGGMERLNFHLVKALASRYRVTVCGPAGCGQHLPLPSSSVAETRHRPLAIFLLGSGLRTLRMARRTQPRFVIAGSGLTAPLAWLASRITGARSIVYLHGLDIVVSSWLYSATWLPLIRRMQLVLVNSRNTAALAEREGISRERIRVLHPGTELPPPDVASGYAFRGRYGLGARPVLLAVGRLTPRKGMAEFVEHVLPKLLKVLPETLLLVIGEDARDAVQRGRGSELERIKQRAALAGVAESVRYLPPCDDVTLSGAYSAADVHVFPVRELAGDVEGFGMVAVEAAAHGLPTVGFDSGGVADAVVGGKTGDLVTPGNYDALTAAIIKRLSSRDDTSVRVACAEAARIFGWDRFGEQLCALLDECGRSAPPDRT